MVALQKSHSPCDTNHMPVMFMLAKGLLCATTSVDVCYCTHRVWASIAYVMKCAAGNPVCDTAPVVRYPQVSNDPD